MVVHLVTEREADILAALSERPLTQAELVRQLDLCKGFVSKTCARFLAAGALEREGRVFYLVDATTWRVRHRNSRARLERDARSRETLMRIGRGPRREDCVEYTTCVTGAAFRSPGHAFCPKDCKGYAPADRTLELLHQASTRKPATCTLPRLR